MPRSAFSLFHFVQPTLSPTSLYLVFLAVFYLRPASFVRALRAPILSWPFYHLHYRPFILSSSLSSAHLHLLRSPERRTLIPTPHPQFSAATHSLPTTESVHCLGWAGAILDGARGDSSSPPTPLLQKPTIHHAQRALIAVMRGGRDSGGKVERCMVGDGTKKIKSVRLEVFLTYLI